MRLDVTMCYCVVHDGDVWWYGVLSLCGVGFHESCCLVVLCLCLIACVNGCCDVSVHDMSRDVWCCVSVCIRMLRDVLVCISVYQCAVVCCHVTQCVVMCEMCVSLCSVRIGFVEPPVVYPMPGARVVIDSLLYCHDFESPCIVIFSVSNLDSFGFICRLFPSISAF